jgi:hypothetical protein
LLPVHSGCQRTATAQQYSPCTKLCPVTRFFSLPE